MAVLCTAFFVCLSGFFADDSLIVFRYARNFLAGQGIVFNPGERVSALTSPFHFFVVSLLTLGWSDATAANKVLSALLVVATLTWAGIRIFPDPIRRAVFWALTLCSPFLLLWTAGGLETPLLIAANAGILVLAWESRRGAESLPRQGILFALAGAAFLIRYDSALFTAPLVLGQLLHRRRDWRSWLLLVGAALLPLMWLVFSWNYFGSIFPTSFFVKANNHVPVRSVLYFLQFSLFTLLFLPLLPLVRARSRARTAVVSVVREHAPLCIGLGFELSYVLVNGVAHMMFGYRMYVPYLAPIAVLAVEAGRRVTAGSGSYRRDFMPVLGGNAILALIVLFKTLNPSVIQIPPLLHLPAIPLPADEWGRPRRDVFEYAHEPAISYVRDFLPALRVNAAQMTADWMKRPASRSRVPRVATFAAGVLPWDAPDSYVLESLISYRKKCRVRYNRVADYIEVLWPRHGSLQEQLADIPGAEFIGGSEFPFDGETEHSDIYYNPHSLENPLPNRIDVPCLPGSPDSFDR